MSIKNFQHNRFGRTGFLAKAFIEQRDDLKAFWDEYVDENSNLLVLAVHAYLKSEWFLEGCQIYKVIFLECEYSSSFSTAQFKERLLFMYFYYFGIFIMSISFH